MFRFHSALLACALAFFVSRAFAQTGAIQGTITDSAGATVPKAKVTAFDQDKQVVARETVTGSGGDFFLSPLLPAHYTVRVEAAGFKTFESKDLTLDQNQVMNLGVLTLQLGQLTESVAVEAQVPIVETSTAQKSFIISSKEVTEIPLNGRDFQTLM